MDANKVIEQLCDKFSCTFNELVPQYAHYAIMCDIFGIIICLVIFAVSVIALYFGITEKIDNEFLEATCVICGSIGGVITVIILILCIADIIPWLIDPEMAMIDRIGRLLD